MGRADSYEIRIRGGQHHDFEKACKEGKLNEKTELRLIRDPDNPFDNRAIRAFAGDLCIGFVAADQAKRLYWRFDRGAIVQRCTVTSIDPKGRCDAWLELRGGWKALKASNDSPSTNKNPDENLDDDIPF